MSGKTLVIDGETFSAAMRVALDNLTVDWQTVTQLHTNTRTLESLVERGLVEKRPNPRYIHGRTNMKLMYQWRLVEED
jgi:hypothetical protein